MSASLTSVADQAHCDGLDTRGQREMKNDAAADSPTSVLEDEDNCENIMEVQKEDGILDSSLISSTMKEEEEKLALSREKEVKADSEQAAPQLNDSQFTKLDELLTQTQLYTEFLLEKMDEITQNGGEQENETVVKNKGRGSKRKTAAGCNTRKAKRAVAAMLTRSKEVESAEDANLSEEDKVEKEQRELVPLLTGGKLKSYQLKGVKWLISLWQNGLNGILADQMGLGKTIQTIGFLAHLKGKGLDGPYLVIAPLSTLANWVNEFARFDLSGKCNSEGMKEEQEEKKRSQVVAKLHSILRPFLLRRLKIDVELLLPRKKEIILYATMTEYQRNFQDHLINKTLENHLRDKVYAGCGMKGKLNNLYIQLRKNCNHPDLLESAFDGSYMYPPVEQIVEQCGKFQLLDRLLKRLFELKHKVLIFSQWTKILDIMDYYFSEKGFEVCRIDGSVRLEERRRQIDEFNDLDSNCRVFLLSTRAGGLGINLTAADTCILYDSDWNPQMDLQAMDRCHRIGQTKPVHVYRLATAQSIEGRILKRAFSKLKLEHVVIGKGQFHQERAKANPMADMEEDDILALLRDEETAEDKLIQTDISDEDLVRLMDRSDLINSSSDDKEGNGAAAVSTFPLKGPGWEVVSTISGGVLSTLNS
ncbi:ATP-dependent DNA helicase DDM1 [Linum perenne]